MLKLKHSAGASATSMSPTNPDTPRATDGAKTKVKLKVSKLQTPSGVTRHEGYEVTSKKRASEDDISPAPKRTAPSPGPTRKPSLILNGPKGDRGNTPLSASGAVGKLKLKASKPSRPRLKTLNVKRPPPPRVPGQGYDSEDSEVETDPAIQQTFVLRMPPGEDCDYIREAIAKGKVGVAPNEGGADVTIRFIDSEIRRGIVTVQKRMYAAVLVDLPCIVESMKSWDRKGWMKVADTSQMLLVLGRCSNEDEARSFPLPREVDRENMQYAHGLTPPMHWVRNRRFRKRLNYKSIVNVEDEVERLLQEDAAIEERGGEVTDEYFDRTEAERGQDTDAIATDQDGGSENDELDQEYFEDGPQVDLEGGLQAMFDAESASANVSEARDPSAAVQIPGAEAPTPTVAVLTEPIAQTPGELTQADDHDGLSPDLFEETTPAHSPSVSSSEEEDEDEEEAESEPPEELDEDAAAKAAERNQQLEEIEDLAKEVAKQRTKAENQKNQLLKEKAILQLRQLENDLRVKRGALGLDENGEAE